MSANERGLGRGLDALFRNVTPAERPSSAKADSAEVPGALGAQEYDDAAHRRADALQGATP